MEKEGRDHIKVKTRDQHGVGSLLFQPKGRWGALDTQQCGWAGAGDGGALEDPELGLVPTGPDQGGLRGRGERIKFSRGLKD